jgi:oligopeptidase A
MLNPLLTDYQLPPFTRIRPEHAEPAVRTLLDGNRRQLAALLEAGADGWDGLVAPIERMHHVLARAWSPIGHLNSVLNGEELRAAYNACLPLLTSYHTELAQNAALCAALPAHPRPGGPAARTRSSASSSKMPCVTSGSRASRCRRIASSASGR